MSQQENLRIVREIYDAVGRGDVAAILDRVTGDVDWSAEAASHAAPWYGPRTGKTGVTSFFRDLADSIEITEFTPHSFAAGQDDVHLLVRWTFRSVITGLQASMTMHHYWRIRDGKIEHFRGSEDTGQTALVLTPELTPTGIHKAVPRSGAGMAPATTTHPHRPNPPRACSPAPRQDACGQGGPSVSSGRFPADVPPHADPDDLRATAHAIHP